MRRTITLPRETWEALSKCVHVGNVDGKRGQASAFIDLAVRTLLTVLRDPGDDDEICREITREIVRISADLSPTLDEDKITLNSNLAFLALAILTTGDGLIEVTLASVPVIQP